MNDAAGSGVTIRAAEFSDAAILAALMGELGYETRAAEMEIRLEVILKDSHYATLVAASEGRVCGMIGTLCRHSYEHNGSVGWILALVVTRAMRGRGREFRGQKYPARGRQHTLRAQGSARILRSDGIRTKRVPLRQESAGQRRLIRRRAWPTGRRRTVRG